MAVLFPCIVNSRRHAAVAVDVYLMRASRSWYYYLLPKFDMPGYVNTTFTTEVVDPIRWDGVTTVITLVGTHLVLVWCVAALYVRRRWYTLMKNYWDVIAQVVSDDTLSFIEK